MMSKLVIWILTGCLASALSLAAIIGDEIPGVDGELVVVRQQQDEEAAKDVVRVHAGDMIELALRFPSGQLTRTKASSDDVAVKFQKIRLIRMEPASKQIGEMSVGAFFTAESEGSADLEFEIKLVTGGSKSFKCHVEVAK